MQPNDPEKDAGSDAETPQEGTDGGGNDAGADANEGGCELDGGRAPTPFCDESCSDACGCALCTPTAVSSCSNAEDGSYITHCAESGLCIERTPCAADEVCGRTSPHFVACVAAGQISGQAVGLTQALTLNVVWSAGVIGDAGSVVVQLAGDGTFASPKIPLAAMYAATLDPPVVGCSVSHARGTIQSPESKQITVSCGAATPCDDAGYSCFRDTTTCPYEFTAVSAAGGPAQPTESASLSCASDGSATPDATCCRTVM